MYLGIDISKDYLDCHKLSDEHSQAKRFENNKKGIKALVKWSADCKHVVMEATGVYWSQCQLKLWTFSPETLVLLECNEWESEKTIDTDIIR